MKFSISKLYTNDYYLIINFYLIAMSATYLFTAISNYVSFGWITDVSINIFITIVSSIGFIINKNRILRLNNFKKFAFLYIILIIFSTTYYCIKYQNINNLQYFYFPLMTCLPIVFDQEEDESKMIILFSFCIIAFFIVTILPNKITIINEELKFYKRNLLGYYHMFFCVIFLSFNFLFLVGKHRYFSRVSLNAKKLEQNMQNSNYNISPLEISELVNIAELNSILFLEKFYRIYPDFVKQITVNSQLNNQDIFYCALMKLGLDTKDIAIISNSSPKAVESRKYRIKKKLQIISETKISDYLYKL